MLVRTGGAAGGIA